MARRSKFSAVVVSPGPDGRPPIQVVKFHTEEGGCDSAAGERLLSGLPQGGGVGGLNARWTACRRSEPGAVDGEGTKLGRGRSCLTSPRQRRTPVLTKNPRFQIKFLLD